MFTQSDINFMRQVASGGFVKFDLNIGQHHVGVVSFRFADARSEADELEGMPLEMAARATEFSEFIQDDGGEVERRLADLLAAGVVGGVRLVRH
ncbi:hypothetical protein AB4Y45_32770 [Paraburkholderia sp. EG287A]|uniref:hypothetical protein n=1 Tax=Paraburkholderia sp. EG287A TaxID=3237012 RepID=UPI0034D1D11B